MVDSDDWQCILFIHVAAVFKPLLVYLSWQHEGV